MARAAALRLIAPVLAAALAGAPACDSGQETASAPAAPDRPGPVSVPAEIAGQRFHLELAADPATRYRGLGGRDHLPEGSGMLFAFPRETPRAFVMRGCRIPLDVAFLDDEGRVVAVHSMAVEPPRRPDESARDYEARLPRYESGAPARFAVEVRGGRLAELGLAPGDRVELDREAVLRRTH